MVEEEQFYPPEEMFREEFVKSVEEAEKEIKEGKSKRYSYDEFKKTTRFHKIYTTLFLF